MSVRLEPPIKELVEMRLSDLFTAQQKLSPTAESRLLLQRISMLVLRAGKRIRPQLLQMTYLGYGGNQQAQLVDIGAALELHHQFLLIHDDIMDNDTIRYDGPNITGFYLQDATTKHFSREIKTMASSMALLAGNLLFTFACQLLLNHPTLKDAQKVALLKLLQATNIDVHHGQQLDIENILALNPKTDFDALLLINSLKTARYTAHLPMQMAASLLDLNAAERTKIDSFAEAFGILYQLVDDYCDYFQNQSSLNNHPKHRDFRQGKITYPLQEALNRVSAEDALFLRQHAGNKRASKQTMVRIVSIMESCGARAASKHIIDGYQAKAHEELEALSMQPDSKARFLDLLATLKV